MEITAYRYRQRSDGSVTKDEGKIDIPDNLKDKWQILQMRSVICSCELLNTGEVAWYLEHEPTQYTLAIEIEKNVPNRPESEILASRQKLFDQVDERTVQQRIETEAYA